MSEDKSKAERLGGPFMIQDRDHMSEIGQIGHESRQGRQQSEQSQGDSDQHRSSPSDATLQQGGERIRRRPKLL